MTIVDESCCLTHSTCQNEDFQEILDLTKVRLVENQANLSLPLDEELEILKQITQFELGVFLLLNRGLNAFWTDYIISGDHSMVDPNSLEYWLLNSSPIVTATQERFKIFQAEIQKRLTSNMKLASIPCGAMKELLELDYSNASNVHLYGFDIDPNSLSLGKETAENIENKSFSARFEIANAWHLTRSDHEKFDLITSNGLNIYEPDEAKLLVLYVRFFNLLNKGGYLVTSFLTHSPHIDPQSPWKNYDPENLIKQKAIIGDIIRAKWQSAWTEAQMINHLEYVGFRIEKIIYDSKCMFPTIVAVKD